MFKNIIYHWTAGNYTPCADDLEHYHFIIDKNGKVYNGKYKPNDNLNCTDGKYAAHVGGGNTGRIGISICCRKDLNTPPTKAQIETMCKIGAQCCHLYGLQPYNCITHAEFGKSHPKTSSYGKIDINSIPYAKISGVLPCGVYLRQRTEEYYKQIKG